MATLIYKDQTAVRLSLASGVDFDTYTPSGLSIEYVKPDGTQGDWDAVVLSGSETTGIVYVDFTNDIKFDQSGWWNLFTAITLTDGRTAPGRSVSYYVPDSGERY